MSHWSHYQCYRGPPTPHLSCYQALQRNPPSRFHVHSLPALHDSDGSVLQPSLQLAVQWVSCPHLLAPPAAAYAALAAAMGEAMHFNAPWYINAICTWA